MIEGEPKPLFPTIELNPELRECMVGYINTLRLAAAQTASQVGARLSEQYDSFFGHFQPGSSISIQVEQKSSPEDYGTTTLRSSVEGTLLKVQEIMSLFRYAVSPTALEDRLSIGTFFGDLVTHSRGIIHFQPEE